MSKMVKMCLSFLIGMVLMLAFVWLTNHFYGGVSGLSSVLSSALDIVTAKPIAAPEPTVPQAISGFSGTWHIDIQSLALAGLRPIPGADPRVQKSLDEFRDRMVAHPFPDDVAVIEQVSVNGATIIEGEAFAPNWDISKSGSRETGKFVDGDLVWTRSKYTMTYHLNTDGQTMIQIFSKNNGEEMSEMPYWTQCGRALCRTLTKVPELSTAAPAPATAPAKPVASVVSHKCLDIYLRDTLFYVA